MTNSCRENLASVRFWSFVLILLRTTVPVWGSAEKQSPSAGNPAPAKVTACVCLLNTPVITIDQTTGSGEAVLLLTNQTDKEANAALLGTIASPANSPAYVEFFNESGTSADRLYQAKLAAKATAKIRAVVRGAWEDGEFDIDVTNHYGAEKIGKVHVRRLPVGIKLEGADRLKLALVDGVRTRIMVRNDDPENYSVTWKLVNGEEICSGPKDPIDLKPKTVAALECTPKLAWDAGRITNLLKADQSRDGYTLLLLPHPLPPEIRPDSAIQPLKVFRGEAALDFFKPLTRALIGYPILTIILLLGGVSSLLLSYFLPNKLQRLSLRDQLVSLAARTSDLSTRIDSKLAVLVRLERSRLADL